MTIARSELVERLTRELVRRLAPVVPARIELIDLGNAIGVLLDGDVSDEIDMSWIWASQIDAAEAREQLPVAIERTLDRLQDSIAEDTAQPWPAKERWLPTPDTIERDGAIHLWFGGAEDPVLVLDPIPLTTLLRDA